MPAKLQSQDKVIGLKQTRKALNQNKVDRLYLAQDADDHLLRELREMAGEKNIEIVYVTSMKELGEKCGIAVGAATVALLK